MFTEKDFGNLAYDLMVSVEHLKSFNPRFEVEFPGTPTSEVPASQSLGLLFYNNGEENTVILTTEVEVVDRKYNNLKYKFSIRALPNTSPSFKFERVFSSVDNLEEYIDDNFVRIMITMTHLLQKRGVKSISYIGKTSYDGCKIAG